MNLTVEKRVKLGVPSAGTLRRKGIRTPFRAYFSESKIGRNSAIDNQQQIAHLKVQLFSQNVAGKKF
ncbi:hypothetical protein AVEN_163799-1 [Araneus ventricosus]|uniref:Uncharacterized protein n=1 Tax=Araneus ventricosus TaxID=182803 RepID=A0A4Y2EBH9_ARAVE|nr:hypothetical protein AVEN_163799-1 [Araneus ventricosus]